MNIYQSEAAECGLASIAMIANHHGHKIDMSTLRNRYNISFKGANLEQLMQLAEQLNLAGRALRLDINELKNLKTPCILHWNMNHFVVLKAVFRRSITILDPAVGERRVNMNEVNGAFTGIALELEPTSKFVRKEERAKLTITSFWSRIDGLISSIVKLLFLSLILQLLILSGPYYTQLVVDKVLISFDKPLLAVLALGFGLIMLIRVLTETLRSWVILHLSSTMITQMATNLMRHLINLPTSYFGKRHIGDVVSRFGSLNSIRDLFTNKIVEGIIDGLLAVTVLIMMFLYDSTLAFVVLSVVILYAVLRLALYRPLHLLTQSSIVASASEQSNFMETIRGIQCIKLFGQQSQRLNLWQNKFTDAINEEYRLGKWQISYQTINSLLFGFENVLVIYLAAIAVMEGSMTVGMLFAFMAYKTQFTSRMSGLISNLIEIKMTSLHLDRLADIALARTEDESAHQHYQEISGQIAIEGLSFRYADNEPLLFNNLHLNADAGSNIAIVGTSGAGKSTLIKLMLGLIKPETGKIKVDGMDISNLGIKNFRQQVSSVMQDDQLMTGTLAENISFFDHKMEFKRVMAAAESAGIHQDIVKMNMGYNSLVGDMGNALSGGQKQRILLARALYRRPKILFLDEATSHLDIALEQYVNSALQKLPVTRIVIAHRPQTILSADKIYQLHQGRLRDITKKYKSRLTNKAKC